MTLASVNHQFNRRTPGGPNNEAANGADYGPPAPPRDGRDRVAVGVAGAGVADLGEQRRGADD